MPHSSGGGSHGGGSHSSYGGHHGSYGRSTPMLRIRRNHFAGARRYRYYRNGNPEYVYSNTDVRKLKLIERPILIIVYLVFIVAVIGNAFPYLAEKLSIGVDKHIVIEDRIGVIEDEASLRAAMKTFLKKSGVTPAVITVRNEDWKYSGDLKEYAYNLYLSKFKDEMHWLIVYSEPEHSLSDGYVDWYWEGMQGNYTDEVITYSLSERFRLRVQDDLEKGHSPREAIENAFDGVNGIVKKASLLDVFINGLLSVGVLAFLLVHAYFVLGINPKASLYKNAELVDEAGNIIPDGTLGQ